MQDNKIRKTALITVIVTVNIIFIIMASISIFKSIKNQLYNQNNKQDSITEQENVIEDENLIQYE